jgi:hypothetical protein
MKKLSATAICTLVLTVMTVGTADAGRLACRGDFEKYCAAEQAGTDGVRRCMRRHFNDLSDDCKAYIKEMRAEKSAKDDTDQTQH